MPQTDCSVSVSVKLGSMSASSISHTMIVSICRGILVLACLSFAANAKDKAPIPQPAPVPTFSPALQPAVTGEFVVGIINITFKETAIPGDINESIRKLGTVSGISQEEYFKIYSNDITWPKMVTMPDEQTVYRDPHFYGYYCKYEYWENPIGWKDAEEGGKRTEKMNQEALRFANKSYRGSKPRFLCYNYVTKRPASPEAEVSAALLGFYNNRSADPDRTRMLRQSRRKSRKKEPSTNQFDPWAYYAPECRWGDPMWPNSKMQINNFAGGTFAHELGHELGAPDVYHVGRFNDGIGGTASLMSYGPTANAFSRFYHHGWIKERNYPTLKTAGSYTLSPRHIKPDDSEAIGFLIPTNHPHYIYQVEYVHNENSTVGVGPGQSGLLISVINLGRSSFLGSPDYFYTYRPNDPYFRSVGDAQNCLFGKIHGRTEFNMTTEPSSRLPNLVDSGVTFKNIRENGDTISFDLEVERHPVTGSSYTKSMLPQIRLDGVTDVQATSFTMDCTIKFRGEPVTTSYGFCWSTSNSPTVRDSVYTLAHRERYQGHAIHLTPDTTYHVRAFASNGVGVRYSDEELVVKTLGRKAPAFDIGPLFTDSFSNNGYLFRNYSNETSETSESFIGYSPTCVLAKLIAYYRPERFSTGDPKAADIDFDELSWNPGDDDFPMRLEEVDRYFDFIYDKSRELQLHSPKPTKDFIRNLVKLTGVRSKPLLSVCDTDTIKEVSGLMRADLVQSRPVIVMFVYDSETVSDPIRWALVDGISSTGRFHVDFPHNSKFFMDGGLHDLKSGDWLPEELILPNYKTYVVTSCYYQK